MKFVVLALSAAALALLVEGGPAVSHNRIDAGYPLPVGGGMPPNVDAIFQWFDGKTYCFKGDKYWRYNDETDMVESGYPKSIKAGWSGVPDNLDAVFRWSDGKTYFFRGGKYWRYNDEANKIDSGYPKFIKEDWPGVPSNLDAVFRWSDDRTYFFKRSKVWRYDDEAKKVDPEYPALIKKEWIGVPDDLDTGGHTSSRAWSATNTTTRPERSTPDTQDQL
ncbi:hypothetical protein BSKO_09719 [Bryopsis sp. KO-2023]|nr:hypothetical protein BSKO_09719 [Bryopsis sp. KO-2023]